MRYFQNSLKFVPANNRSPKVIIIIFSQVLGSIISEGSINELCPACGEALPTTNLYDETCPNGHTWSELINIVEEGLNQYQCC